MNETLDTALDIPAQQDDFRNLLDDVLAHARKLGASQAAAEVSANRGLSVGVRKCRIETIEQTRDRSLGVTLFHGLRRGSASTTDLSAEAMRHTVEAAWHIARHTAEDPAAGLPEADQLALHYPELELYHPWSLGPEEAARLAIRAERAALRADSRITNTEGASLDTGEGHFVLANTQGFMGGYAYSRHSLSVVPIAGSGDAMQRDYWYTSSRRPQDLLGPLEVGREAARRVLARLGARPVPSGRYPVLFEAPLAAGLIGSLVRAASGGALYRKTSFLADSLGKTVLASHLDLVENPYIPAAQGSAPFDAEGVRPQARKVVDAGVLHGYFLSCYTARKLALTSTGNAGGSHNLVLRSRRTSSHDDLPAMLRKMGTGLLVTELMGQGINYVTGDYSRGAFGYWVQNGEIQHPVQEITIAGNLKDMFQQIVAVGADAFCRGGKTTGSVLIEQVSIAASRWFLKICGCHAFAASF